MQKIIKIVCLVCLNVNNDKSYYSKQHTGMPLGTHTYNIIVEAGYPKPAYFGTIMKKLNGFSDFRAHCKNTLI